MEPDRAPTEAAQETDVFGFEEFASQAWGALMTADEAVGVLKSINLLPEAEHVQTLQMRVRRIYERFFFDGFVSHALRGPPIEARLARVERLLNEVITLTTGGNREQGVFGRARASVTVGLLISTDGNYALGQSPMPAPGTQERKTEIMNAIWGVYGLRSAVRGTLRAIAERRDLERTARVGTQAQHWGLKPGAKLRTPEFDVAIGRFAYLYEDLTGKMARVSERPAVHEKVRGSDGPFVRFVLAVTKIALAYGGGYEPDDEKVWRKLFEPTPDEIREALERFRKHFDAPRDL